MADVPTLQTVHDRPHAPLIFFDGVATVTHYNGIIGLTLGVSVQTQSEGGVVLDQVVAAYLRTNMQGAITLRDSLNKALLMATPPPNDSKN